MEYDCRSSLKTGTKMVGSRKQEAKNYDRWLKKAEIYLVIRKTGCHSCWLVAVGL